MLEKNIDLNGKTILVTGAAGFIGSFLVRSLLEGYDAEIIGLDNINSYYDVNLKYDRLKEIEELVKNILSSGEKTKRDFAFIKTDISDKEAVFKVFAEYKPDVVVNLAAQAGVRYSIENPDAYIQSNIIGFYNILEACRHYPVQHLVYASSSSVYGGNKKVPFSTDDKVDNPVSLYAATKKSNELLSYSYSKLYGIPTTGLRFFTVYGPAGRPDMAYFSFANKLTKGEKIQVFNYGNCKRDFTYVDDIVKGVELVMQTSPKKMLQTSLENTLQTPSEKPAGVAESSAVPYKVYNIGGGQPENLMDFVEILAEELKKAGVLQASFDIKDYINLVPMQPGDVEVTYADSSALEKDYGFTPKITLREGLGKFAQWYADYYKTIKS